MFEKMRKLIRSYQSADVMMKATLWFTVVTLMNRGVSLLTQPLVNRILSVEEVGLVNIYTTWSSIFSILATFNLFCGVLEVQITKNREDTGQIVGSLASLSCVIFAVFFVLIGIFVQPIAAFLELRPIYLLIMAIAILSQAMLQFWCVPKRFAYSYRAYALVVVLVFVCQSALTVLLSWKMEGDRVLGRILGLCIPEAIVAVVILIGIVRRTDFSSITKYWKTAFRFNLPLIPHYLSSLLLASSDKIMIQKMVGDQSVGIYSVAYSYAGLGLIVFTALNNAYTPFAMKAIREEDYRPLAKKTNWLILLSVLTAAIMSLVAPEALYVLGGNVYLEALPMIPALVVGVFFSSFYFVFSNVEFVYERTKPIFPITLLGCVLNIGLNWALIPFFGYTVAAYTTIIGYLVITLLHYLVSCKIVGKNIYQGKKIVLYVLVLILLCLVSVPLYGLIVLRYLIVAALIGCFLIVFTKNKGEV